MFFTGIANAQIVTIPDANFKNKLVNTLCIDTNSDGYGDADVDTNNDGEIQNSEAEAVLNLNVSFPNFTPTSDQISDLTGINSFINLEGFECRNNNLGSVDFSGLSHIKILNCGFCNIFALNVSGLINLESLYCDYNQISVLNLNSLINLKSLSCYNNQLSALNLTGLTNLISLECGKNHISSLNLASTPNLLGLRCSDNLLNTLNVNFLTHLSNLEYGNLGLNNVAISNLVNLGDLFITGGIQNSINLTPLVSLYSLRLTNTNFIQIDVSGIPYLNRLYIYGNYSLNYINMKNGNNFDQAAGGNGVYFDTNPNLNFICADERNIPLINLDLLNHGNTTTQVNSYCSFTPGGNYNTITGTLTFDANNNGCDASDDIQSNIRVNINDGTTTGANFTNSSGNYTFYTQTGSFAITPSIENPTWFNFSPTSITIPFANNNNNTVTQNFCIAANGVHPDLEVVIAPIARARPGFDAVYKIVYKNKGNQTLSGNVAFSYDDTVLDFVSSTVIPSSQSTGLLTYNYTNLLPFENRSFYITLHVNTPTDTPAVNIGDNLSFTATLSPIPGDEIPSDNTFQFNQTVVGSYDPNDITCIEGNVVPPTEIGNFLHYVINFENTGTADAENIVVKDIIDTTQFDVNSLQVLNSSAPITAKLTGNIAEFIFQNINLHSGGHGNILIKIKSNNTLAQGDTVSKKANIFFDYNAPIDTSLENTTFQALSNPNFDIDASISIYPNPTKGNVNINCNSTIKSVQLYDVQGRLLQTNLINENQANIDISNQSKGIYFLKITSDKGIGVEKIVKE